MRNFSAFSACAFAADASCVWRRARRRHRREPRQGAAREELWPLPFPRSDRRSPLPQAPPLREVYLKYPIDQLEEGFAEGMGSRHRDMPQIQFSDDQVAAILNYLGSITGVDPWEPARAVTIPGETPP